MTFIHTIDLCIIWGLIMMYSSKDGPNDRQHGIIVIIGTVMVVIAYILRTIYNQ